MIIGTIGSPRRAHVRAGGLIALQAGTPDEILIDWWVGADDRWYRPDTEITSRQHLIRNAPIVQTSVRIPSGDAILTSFGAVQGQRELVVCDVENRSKVPFAIAIVLRGPGVRDVSVNGAVVRVGGYPLLTLPRAPQRFALVPAGEDLAGVVMSGAATPNLPQVDDAGRSVEVALILPVTHGTTLRYAALLGASSGVALASTPVLTSLPDVHRAASGWGAHLGRLPVIALPDTQLAAQAAANGAALLLAAEPAIAAIALDTSTRAALATALALSGCLAESGALLEHVGDLQLSNGSFDGDNALISAHMIRALSTHASLSNDLLFADSLASNVAGALEFVLKRSARAGTTQPVAVLVDAARFFTVADDTRAAAQCRKKWAKAGSPWPLPELPLPPLPAVGLGGSLVPDDPVRLAAAVIGSTRRVGVVDAEGNVDIVPGFVDEWRGAKLDVRNLATPAGRLSFSFRWHGARPAVLWDIEEPTGAELRLRCSSIDPAWKGRGPKGEALLNIAPLPGVADPA
jgi:hypothetical protein